MSAGPAARPLVDRAGLLASGLCVVHCAVCAVLPSLLVVLGLGVLLSHEAEWGFSLVAVGVAAIALVRGWLVHRSGVIALLFVTGIVGLLASRYLEENAELIGTAVGVAAGIGLIVGHVLNLRRLRDEARLASSEATAGSGG